MINPTHLGESVRECIVESGCTITECAAQLGMTRNALSRLLNGRTVISPSGALEMESLGWSNAEFWMQIQPNYNPARERRKRVVA